MEKDKKLDEEFKRSSVQDPVDFFIYNKGWVKTTCQRYYKKCIYSSSRLTEKQRQILLYYKHAAGYEMDDLDVLGLQQKNKNAGRWNTGR